MVNLVCDAKSPWGLKDEHVAGGFSEEILAFGFCIWNNIAFNWFVCLIHENPSKKLMNQWMNECNEMKERRKLFEKKQKWRRQNKVEMWNWLVST